jgi:hypothetical protein
MAHINVRSCSQLGSAELGDDAHQRKLRACCLHACELGELYQQRLRAMRAGRVLSCAGLFVVVCYLLFVYLRSGATLTVCCLRVCATTGQ